MGAGNVADAREQDACSQGTYAPDACEQDGFFRVAAATPKIRVADVEGNVSVTLACIREAAVCNVGALVLPELGLTGYTCADLFHDRVLLAAAEHGVARLLAETADLPILFAVGVPVEVRGALYNCAAVCCRGELLGLVAKSFLPNHGEFYERRWFSPAPQNPVEASYCGKNVLMGRNMTFRALDVPGLTVGVEICEDLWVADPPSRAMAEGGASVILNLSASDEVIGKEGYRRSLVANQSARLYCAYAYADAGFGESTTDLVFTGHNLVAENGAVLAETPLFSCDMAVADVDLQRLEQERLRSNTWSSAKAGYELSAACAPVNEQTFRLGYAYDASRMTRTFPRTPFVPEDKGDLAHRCEVILGLQAEGLATRLAHTGCRAAVIGISGGLDSTLALLVAVRAFDRLDLPRTGIVAVSMPGFGTTSRTRGNALGLAEALGVQLREVPIGAAVERHFSDIGHDPQVMDVTYENSQARERTQVLMDIANQEGGMVVGTGDLSELALGWATYNADHMSMYGVNASVPKTLVRHLVRYAAGLLGGEAERVLLDVLDTPVSPELLPPTGDGTISQRTEDLVGPYELHDFFLYHALRFGFAPGKVFRMACRAFATPGSCGDAPHAAAAGEEASGEKELQAGEKGFQTECVPGEGVAAEKPAQSPALADGEGACYDPHTIWMWMRTFYRRFFSQQFKRSCLPDGPKVGSVTLSPRGDWRMPSDASSALWLVEIDALEPKNS